MRGERVLLDRSGRRVLLVIYEFAIARGREREGCFRAFLQQHG